MDLTIFLSEWVDEVLGATNSYALTHVAEVGTTAEAAAFIRLRLAVYDSLIAEGWTPPATMTERIDRDRALLEHPDVDGEIVAVDSRAEDFAVLRAKAARVREEARETSQSASDQREIVTQARREVVQMREALESRAVIEQAKGIAMERYGLTVDVAWAWLVRTSQQRNLKLRFIAEELVASTNQPAAAAAAGSGQVEPPSTPPSTQASTPASRRATGSRPPR